ncbi:MAG: 4-hydroxy-tetrahydrodipicolinate reductase, partial [Kangiellaceae bacterium]
MKVNIAVNAATGRMGQQIIDAATNSQKVELVAAFCRSAHPFFGKTVRGTSSKSSVKYTNDILSGISFSQVIIDFSLPSVSLSLLENAVKSKTPLLIGTTGFNQQQKEVITKASELIPIMLESNTSIGANMMMKLLSVAAKSIGQHAHIEIVEYHHKNKIMFQYFQFIVCLLLIQVLLEYMYVYMHACMYVCTSDIYI